ncbi:MAG TPA: (2Fe-2S)-binding protein [Gillisia sp.]|nr:(2Fe-2S)-binding protein [Gillisia sp.]
MKEKINLKVNGKEHSVEVDPSTPLLYVLRNNLELNGPKYGCGLQQCGSCMVLLNGEATPSCRIPVSAMKDMEIVTLEGLQKETGELHSVQEAFYEEQAAQCGFCLNGMVISTVALLEKNSNPDRGEILEGLERVLCRCGTHSRIIKAVETAGAKISR